MIDQDIEAALIAKLAESRDTTPEEVRDELERLGEIDSLEGVELVIVAERCFDISISDDELSSEVCRSIPHLIALVRSKLASVSTTGGDAEQ